ncbi:hypothetical protein JL720_7331 [Aureococcus anophagefferens]|nr:hypothetical protein JL720_7331 [Aureococcus anophagefferens]
MTGSGKVAKAELKKRAAQRRVDAAAAKEKDALGEHVYDVRWRDAAAKNERTPGPWLLVDDGRGVAAALRRQLEADGAAADVLDLPRRPRRARRGRSRARAGVGRRRVLAALRPSAAADVDDGADAVARATKGALLATLAVVQAVAGRNLELVVATRRRGRRGPRRRPRGEAVPGPGRVRGLGPRAQRRRGARGARASRTSAPARPDADAAAVLAELGAGGGARRPTGGGGASRRRSSRAARPEGRDVARASPSPAAPASAPRGPSSSPGPAATPRRSSSRADARRRRPSRSGSTTWRRRRARVVLNADVSSKRTRPRLDRAAGLRADGEPLHVWHLAGVVGDAAAGDVAWGDFDDVLRAKVDGSMRLHDATARRRAAGLPALAVSWGTWADAGMAHRFGGGFRAARERAGFGFVPLQAGLAVLADLAGSRRRTECHAAVVPADWRAYAASRAEAQPSPASSAPGSPPRRPPRRGRGRRARRRAILRELLGEEPDDDDAPLASLGLTSIKAVELVAALGEALGEDLSPTLVYEAVALSGVAARLGGAPEAAVPRPRAVAPEARADLVVAGAACRFPGRADLPEELWALFVAEADCVLAEPPADRPHTGLPGAYLAGDTLRNFDRAAFGVSAAEAAATDPQQRLFLECAAEALEVAGLPCTPAAPGGVRGRDASVGVFAAIETSDYAFLHQRAVDEGRAEADAYCGTGWHGCVAPNRVSYVFDLRGPSVALNSACSSS